MQETPTPSNSHFVPWPRPDAPVRLELGGRWLQIKLVEGKAALFDSDEKPVQTLRRKKGDDPELFEEAKGIWAMRRKRPRGCSPDSQIGEALLTGRSLTGAELEQLLGYEYDKSYQRVIWQTIDGSGSGSLRFDEGDELELLDVEGKPWSLDENTRYRLVHPARLDDASYTAWKAKHPYIMQLSEDRRRCRAPSKPTSVSSEFEIWVPKGDGGVVRTPSKSIIAQLEMNGFHRHEEEQTKGPFVLQAPELGAVALATLDDEHGFTALSFNQWDGSPTGGAPIALTDVDVQLYSEVSCTLITMYTDDRS